MIHTAVNAGIPELEDGGNEPALDAGALGGLDPGPDSVAGVGPTVLAEGEGPDGAVGPAQATTSSATAAAAVIHRARTGCRAPASPSNPSSPSCSVPMRRCRQRLRPPPNSVPKIPRIRSCPTLEV